MTVAHDEDLEDKFRHGACYPMAFALAERLGCEIEALVVDVPRGFHLVHVWVVDPEGRAVDAGGPFERSGLHEEYLADTRRKWSNDRLERFATPEAYLARVREGCGEDFWPDYYDHCFLPLVSEAEQAIESYIIPRHLPEHARAAAPAPR